MSTVAELPEKLVSRRQLAKLFGVTTHSVRCWERSGKLPPAIRVGREPHWRQEQIAALLDPKKAG